MERNNDERAVDRRTKGLEKTVEALCLHQGLLGTSAQQLQASSGERNDFALAVIRFLLVGLNVLISNRFHHLYDILRLGDISDELLVLGLEQLEKRPDGDMLESWVSAGKETLEVAVEAAIGVCPIANKDAVVSDWNEVSYELKVQGMKQNQEKEGAENEMLSERKRTFGGQVAQSRRTIPLDLDTLRIGQRDQNIKHAEVEEMRLQLVAESQHSDRGSHFGLDAQRDSENEILAFLDCTGLQHKFLVAIRACREITKCRDGVALNLLVISRAQQVNQRLQKPGFDDW